MTPKEMLVVAVVAVVCILVMVTFVRYRLWRSADKLSERIEVITQIQSVIAVPRKPRWSKITFAESSCLPPMIVESMDWYHMGDLSSTVGVYCTQEGMGLHIKTTNKRIRLYKAEGS